LSIAGLFSTPMNLVGQDGSTQRSRPRSAKEQPPTNVVQDRDLDAPPPGKSQLHRLLDESAGRYDLFAGDDRGEPLKLKCVLRWANLSRGSVDGATYIWTQDGRPLATVCVYPWAGLVCDNFQSLSEGRITAYADGGEVWRCEKPGVAFRPAPGAPVPESSAAGRLRQMKSLAGGFRTTLLGWKVGDGDREELRMLPRPVYQYEKAGLVEGAIFAFVQGTDPEAFLLLEARPKTAEADQPLAWHFALARRTSGLLETRYGDEVVWKAERLNDYSDPRQPHFQRTRPLPTDADKEPK
jgi:hypothetical protein